MAGGGIFCSFFLENYLLPLRVVRACGSICCIRRLIKFHPMFVTIARSIGLEVNSFNGNSIPVKIPKVFSWIERRQLMRWRYVRAPVSSARWDNDVRINCLATMELVAVHHGIWFHKNSPTEACEYVKKKNEVGCPWLRELLPRPTNKNLNNFVFSPLSAVGRWWRQLSSVLGSPCCYFLIGRFHFVLRRTQEAASVGWWRTQKKKKNPLGSNISSRLD